MRILGKLVKVAVALAVAIPVGLFVMALAFGLLGTVIGLTFMAVRLACLGLVAYGVYRVAKFFFAPSPSPLSTLRELPARDPYYEAAMRELDTEIGRP